MCEELSIGVVFCCDRPTGAKTLDDLKPLNVRAKARTLQSGVNRDPPVRQPFALSHLRRKNKDAPSVVSQKFIS